MRSPVAEWILSLVVPKDRASAIVGDLLEAELRGRAFWVELLRSTLSIGAHRPKRFLSNVFGVAFYVALDASWVWLFWRVIGDSLLVSILTLIPTKLMFLRAARRLRRNTPTPPRLP
jgi:hypothetical protein